MYLILDAFFAYLRSMLALLKSNFGLPEPPLEPTSTMIPPGPIFGASLALYEPKLGAKLAQLGANLDHLEPTWSQLGPNLVPTWSQLELSWTNLEPTWGQDEPTRS